MLVNGVVERMYTSDMKNQVFSRNTLDTFRTSWYFMRSSQYFYREHPMNPILKHIEESLRKAETENRFRKVRGLTPLPEGRARIDGEICIDFSSNDYLGLANHEEVVAAAKGWLEMYGAGSKASRLITGTSEAVLGLESRIARWKGTEAALILGSGYMANVGILKSFASRNTVFIADKLNHASLNTGCQDPLSTFKRYRHNDMRQLRETLADTPSDAKKIIVSDTVFSMDGDIADIDTLRSLAGEFNALLYLDDAHAGGVFGENGKGFGGSTNPAEMVLGTCSKAFGGYGAYIACSHVMRDYLINACGSFIFSTALPPAVYGAIDGALSVIISGEGEIRRRRVNELAEILRAGLRERGYNIGNSATPIIPIILGDNDTAKAFAAELKQRGLLCMAICPPTVPQGEARLRISLSAAHSKTDIATLLDTLDHIRK